MIRFNLDGTSGCWHSLVSMEKELSIHFWGRKLKFVKWQLLISLWLIQSKWQYQILLNIIATLILGLRSKQGLVRGRDKRETWKAHLILLGVHGVRKNEPSHSQGNSHLGSWSPKGLPDLQGAIAGVKTHWFEDFFISLESYWIADVKMGSHHPFEHLKHKLWPKERPGVKLAVWLLTTKSQELTQFPCVKVACNIPLESSRWGLQLYFRPYLNQRSAHKVMRLQSRGSPNFGNFGTPTWESRNKKPFGCGPHGEAQSIL